MAATAPTRPTGGEKRESERKMITYGVAGFGGILAVAGLVVLVTAPVPVPAAVRTESERS